MKVAIYTAVVFVLNALLFLTMVAVLVFAAIGEFFDKWHAWAQLRLMLLKATPPITPQTTRQTKTTKA